jgi:hypothetical protein
MDEGYNIIVLDLDFELMKKLIFSTPQMAKFGAAARPYCVLFAPLSFVYP